MFNTIKCMERNPGLTIPRYNDMTSPVPWYIVILGFHCIGKFGREGGGGGREGTIFCESVVSCRIIVTTQMTLTLKSWLFLGIVTTKMTKQKSQKTTSNTQTKTQ